MPLPQFPPISFAWQVIQYNLYFPSDLAGRAYEKAGDLKRAIAKYKQITVFDPKSPDRRLANPLYYYRLAKLYEKSGNKGKARACYGHFLDLWKDADPGLSEVEDAKARLAAL